MVTVWDLYDEIHDKIIEKNMFDYNAMTLKRIHKNVDKIMSFDEILLQKTSYWIK